jgi:hypothetical protein
MKVGDKLVVNGTIRCTHRVELPYLAARLDAEVADVTVDNLGTAVCLTTGNVDLDKLGLFFSPEDVVSSVIRDGVYRLHIAPPR